MDEDLQFEPLRFPRTLEEAFGPHVQRRIDEAPGVVGRWVEAFARWWHRSDE